jgi:hypothetical protein
VRAAEPERAGEPIGAQSGVGDETGDQRSAGTPDLVQRLPRVADQGDGGAVSAGQADQVEVELVGVEDLIDEQAADGRGEMSAENRGQLRVGQGVCDDGPHVLVGAGAGEDVVTVGDAGDPDLAGRGHLGGDDGAPADGQRLFGGGAGVPVGGAPFVEDP